MRIVHVVLAQLVTIAAFLPCDPGLQPCTRLNAKFRRSSDEEMSECSIVVPEALTPIITELKEKYDAVEEDVVNAVEDAVTELAIEQCQPEALIPLGNDVAEVSFLVRKRSQLWWAVKRLVRRTPVPSDDVSSFGDQLEAGWARRGSGSAFRRNVEVWRFGLRCALKVAKASKIDDGLAQKTAATDAAMFIRDGLVKLGPTFVKLGQVVSTRTDVIPDAYISVLRTLQDDVPAFSGTRAKMIIARELNVRSVSDVFQHFNTTPIAAASLGQVHSAVYKGVKVAVKVQRAGLKELFDLDLKNLKKLAALLDKFDPKSDGADRDWVSIYDESARLLYLEIDYLNEARNMKRFRAESSGTPWVRVPKLVEELTTPKVLVMEFIDSLKLTDFAQIEALGLDKRMLAKRTADHFLAQVLRSGFFHCDPHPGNLACDTSGNLVYYDFGMMDELSPTVRDGFRNLCFALFAGGPFISNVALSRQAQQFKLALEQMGVLAKGADTLAVEKFGRFCISTFKEVQKGGKVTNIRTAIGPDLRALTDSQVFRFPSTFTFIFRAFASVDGIGKGLYSDFDISSLAKPFIETFTDEVKYGSKASSAWTKSLMVASEATGLNLGDINTAVSSPRKIAYLEDTVRAIEQGTLKIRVRSLEIERSLERIALQTTLQQDLVLGSILLQLGLSSTLRQSLILGYPVPQLFCIIGAVASGLRALGTRVKVKEFDKKAARYETKEFD